MPNILSDITDYIKVAILKTEADENVLVAE